MKRFKNWLYLNFLPVYAKESVLKERNELKKRVAALEQKNRELRAYANGLEYALRRKIVIKGGE